jgi:hypothetical protein
VPTYIALPGCPVALTAAPSPVHVPRRTLSDDEDEGSDPGGDEVDELPVRQVKPQAVKRRQSVSAESLDPSKVRTPLSCLAMGQAHIRARTRCLLSTSMRYYLHAVIFICSEEEGEGWGMSAKWVVGNWKSQ